MALKVFEGFDHYTAKADLLARSGFLQWQIVSTFQPTFSFVTGRNGFGKALKIEHGAPNSSLRAIWADRNAECIIGVACMFQGTNPSASGCYFLFLDTLGSSSTIQLTVFFNQANYGVQVYRGDGTSGSSTPGTLLASSANNVWANNVWNFIEFKLKIDNSTGSFAVHVNNISIVSGSGLDTQNTGNAWTDALQFNPSPNFPAYLVDMFLDDIYYCDTTTGSGTYPCNDFLNDARVSTLFATGNDSVQWSHLTGTNWGEIAETAMDSDTSYNYSSNPGDEDRFAFGPLESSITVIYGIQLTGAYRKDDAGTRTIKQAVKTGGTVYYGSNHNLPDSNYAYFTDIFILNPNTSANWTLSDVNGATYGYNLVA